MFDYSKLAHPSLFFCGTVYSLLLETGWQNVTLLGYDIKHDAVTIRMGNGKTAQLSKDAFTKGARERIRGENHLGNFPKKGEPWTPTAKEPLNKGTAEPLSTGIIQTVEPPVPGQAHVGDGSHAGRGGYPLPELGTVNGERHEQEQGLRGSGVSACLSGDGNLPQRSMEHLFNGDDLPTGNRRGNGEQLSCNGCDATCAEDCIGCPNEF